MKNASVTQTLKFDFVDEKVRRSIYELLSLCFAPFNQNEYIANCVASPDLNVFLTLYSVLGEGLAPMCGVYYRKEGCPKKVFNYADS